MNLMRFYTLFIQFMMNFMKIREVGVYDKEYNQLVQVRIV